MQINVSQLLKEPIGSTRDYEINTTANITDDGQERPVRGKARLLRIQRGILVTCTTSTKVELECSRCLGTFRYLLTLKFEEEYLPSIDIVSGQPLTLSDEPGTFYIDEHHVIDLTEAIRQYTLLAIPMKPLCDKECAGLCQSCGHNLNQGRCQCAGQVIDPRWSELTKLL
jgi:uncharacterized protein